MVVRKSDSSAFRLVVTLIHLALFAELGVVTRAMMAKLFALGCDGGWGPCLEDGRYFKDLPANLLGCFIIGLFAAASTLGLATDKPLALLPAKHPWQNNFELQIGIRTGYCGSLTTFASWQLELMVPAIQHNLWVQAVMGYLTCLLTSIGCYHVGMHVALAVDWWVLGDRQVLQEMEQYRSAEVQYIQGLSDSGGETPLQLRMLQAEPDLPRLTPTRHVELQQQQLGSSLRLSSKGAAAAVAAAAEEAAAVGGNGVAMVGPAAATAAPVTAGGVAAAAAAMLDATREPRQQNGGLAEARSKQQQGQQQQQERRLSIEDWGSSLAGYRTDAAALVLLVLLTAALAAGASLEQRHKWARGVWFACLLGPPGCILRWWLSRYNYQLAGRWAWFPVGTFAANMLGCAVDFALQCILQRQPVSIGYWGGLLIGSVQTGFCGSLTTVSTFVTEVVKFADAVPSNFRAYSYAAMSLGGGILLALALYGWSVWAY